MKIITINLNEAHVRAMQILQDLGKRKTPENASRGTRGKDLPGDAIACAKAKLGL